MLDKELLPTSGAPNADNNFFFLLNLNKGKDYSKILSKTYKI